MKQERRYPFADCTNCRVAQGAVRDLCAGMDGKPESTLQINCEVECGSTARATATCLEVMDGNQLVGTSAGKPKVACPQVAGSL